MPHEFVRITHDPAKVLGVASFTGRTAMPAGIPRENPIIAEIGPVDKILPAGRVFVPAMKQHDGAMRLVSRRPGPVEEVEAIGSVKPVFRGGSRYGLPLRR